MRLATVSDAAEVLADDDTADSWHKLLIKTGSGDKERIAPNAANVTVVLTKDPNWQGVIEHDQRLGSTRFVSKPPFPGTFASARDTYPREVRDTDLVAIQAYLMRDAGFPSINTDVINAGVEAAAHLRPRDPVRDWLDTLTWDGESRLDEWLTTYIGCKSTEYTRAVGVCWMISAIARTYEPGSQADSLLIFEGTQGTGKSTALRLLAMCAAWFTDSVIAIGTKDAADSLRGPWIVEMSELDAVSKADAATIKSFVSRRFDRYREAYGRRTTNHPRRVVFAGTTNDSTYLRDATGGRRFWPVRTGQIDLAALERDRVQLWAEARYRYDQGEQWHLSGEVARTAAEEVDARHQGDAWEDTIAAYIDGRSEVSVRDIATDALNIEIGKVDQRAQNRIVAVLTRLGWTVTPNPVRRPRGGGMVRVRLYLPPANEDAA